jgi:hypothetical protein
VGMNQPENRHTANSCHGTATWADEVFGTHSAVGHLALGLAWPAAFAAAGLAIFWIRTRTHAS